MIEGPIAVGKTSLARRLSEVLGARLVLEESEENPFLRRFYQEPEKYAFPTQLFFLLNRYRQQQEVRKLDRFEPSVVSDYLFAKDDIFARLNLGPEEYELYRQVYHLLDGRVARPDLVVYLEARVEVLWRRLRQRDRDYERQLAPAYLERVAEAYRRFFHRYAESPLLVVESSEIDFVESGADFADLVREIRTMRRGVQHYVPRG